MKILLNAKPLKRQQKKGRKCNFLQSFTTTSVLKLGHFDLIHLTLSRQCIIMTFSFLLLSPVISCQECKIATNVN